MSEEQTFEAAFAELEAIVTRLERGELTLDESVGAFERGTALLKLCTTKLDAAEKRVRVLLESSDGNVAERLLEDADS